MACAGQIASQSLHAVDDCMKYCAYGRGQILTNAALLAAWIPPQCVLTTEAGRKRALLVRVHDGVWWSEELLKDQPHT